MTDDIVQSDQSTERSQRARPRALTRAAFLVNLAYLLWFWVTFATGYGVYSWFHLNPSVDSLWDSGVSGRIALTAWGLSASVPSWFGIGYARRALVAGGGAPAKVALVLNAVVVVGFVVVIVLTG